MLCEGLTRGLGAQPPNSLRTRTPDSQQPALHSVNYVPRLFLLTGYTGEFNGVSSLLAVASYCSVLVYFVNNFPRQ